MRRPTAAFDEDDEHGANEERTDSLVVSDDLIEAEEVVARLSNATGSIISVFFFLLLM